MSETAEKTVTLEGMQDALDELVKAAEAGSLVKGGVEYSGHIDERGKVGGGGASAADQGGLDDMMIGKLTAAGLDAGTIAAFSEFVGKKADDDDDDDEEDDEVDEMAGKMRAYKAKNGSLKGFPGFGKSDASASDSSEELLIKSFDEFAKDPDIKSAIDVSPYLEAMTMRTAEQIDGLRKSFGERFGDQTDINRKQAAALYQIGSLLKSQSNVIDALAQRLGIVEKTPNPQKGVTNASALHKAMPGEAGKPTEKLSKSELLSTLSYMNLEKGIRHIGPQKTSEAIFMLEGGGLVSNEIIQAAQDFLASNPNLAKEARAYQ